jgi:peroxiredoxin
VRDEMTKYEERGVRPFGLNPATVASHREYAEMLHLPFPLLSDAGLVVSRAYGALRPDGAGIARSVVLVGRDGTVRFAAAGAPGADISLESVGGP